MSNNRCLYILSLWLFAAASFVACVSAGSPPRMISLVHNPVTGPGAEVVDRFRRHVCLAAPARCVGAQFDWTVRSYADCDEVLMVTRTNVDGGVWFSGARGRVASDGVRAAWGLPHEEWRVGLHCE